MAIAALALAGCATDYGGPYRTYPAYTYYDTYPAYTYYDEPFHGGFGRHAYFYDHDVDHDRHFRPARGVTCDRARDVCYDRHGLSYQATKRYLGEREANRSYKEYGDEVFLFSPKKGVTCDRRTEACSKGSWNDYLKRLERRDTLPRPRNNEKVVTQRLSRDLQDRTKRRADNDDADRFARPSARSQPENLKWLLPPPGRPNKDKPGNK